MATVDFTNFINEPISDKVILFEIAKGEVAKDTFWDKYVPGVWKTTLYWIEGELTSSISYGKGTWGNGLYGIINGDSLPVTENTYFFKIGSLIVNEIFYTEKSSKDLVQDDTYSYYFDVTTQILYVNSDNLYMRDPNINMILSNVPGYSNKAHLFDRFYEPRIKSVPNLSISRDNLFNKVVQFNGGTVVLNNKDGEFNNFGDLNVYGQVVSIKYGGDDLDYDDYKEVYTGFLESWSGDGENFSLTINDERKNLQLQIPTNYYEEAIYPNLSEFGFGIAIGIGYGDVRRAIAVCTNEGDTSAATYNFKFVDTTLHEIQSIDNVYVNGIEKAYSNDSTENGTFDLTGDTATFMPGNIVSVSFHGYVTDGDTLIDNPMDIIEDLLSIYADIPYDSDNFNTTAWNTLRASDDTQVALYVKEEKTLISILTSLAQAMLGTFIVEGDGRFNIKVFDPSSSSSKTIYYREIIGVVKETPSFNEYINSCRVGYRRDYSSTSHAYFINTDDQAALKTKFRQNKQQVFKTLISNATDASSLSDNIMQLYGGVFNKYVITTKLQTLELELEDIITVQVRKNNDGTFKEVTGVIVGKTLDLTNGLIKITLKEFNS